MRSNPKTYSQKRNKINQSQLLDVSIGGFSISRRSLTKVTITIPVQVDELSQVEVNGIMFHKGGAFVEVVRIAPVKFHEKHFKEVDDLITIGYKTKAACKEVSDKYNFNVESFRHQYYDRHACKKV